MTEAKARRYSGYRSDLDMHDNGRRGEPLPGCDCERCFGRCILDQDAAQRERFSGIGRPMKKEIE